MDQKEAVNCFVSGKGNHCCKILEQRGNQWSQNWVCKTIPYIFKRVFLQKPNTKGMGTVSQRAVYSWTLHDTEFKLVKTISNINLIYIQCERNHSWTSATIQFKKLHFEQPSYNVAGQWRQLLAKPTRVFEHSVLNYVGILTNTPDKRFSGGYSCCCHLTVHGNCRKCLEALFQKRESVC
mgnify:CR=1 FL=1